MTEAGALGVLGNFDCESNCEPNRVQGDFSPYRSASKQYTADVTNGKIGKSQFSTDGRGYGLYQLTYPTRKAGYYDFWKQSGKPLDSAELQCDYAVKEMKEDYPGLFSFLCTTNDLYQATARVCREFERPAVNNIDARYQAAIRIKNEIDLNDWQDSEPDEPDDPEYEPIPQTEYWPPRMIDKNMTGPDVEVLQAVLKARGYIVTNPDGIFGSYLETVVKKFQSDIGLDPDGVVGPMTWGELLKR